MFLTEESGRLGVSSTREKIDSDRAVPTTEDET
jgi:hypothetical protein